MWGETRGARGGQGRLGVWLGGSERRRGLRMVVRKWTWMMIWRMGERMGGDRYGRFSDVFRFFFVEMGD